MGLTSATSKSSLALLRNARTLGRRALTTAAAAAVTIDTNKANTLHERIGLEIHARITSRSKIFSDADSHSLASNVTNASTAFMDAGMPGTMPTLNRRCVEAGLMSALALNCHINGMSHFERKHYFYADLPAGYQITQQQRPIATTGHVLYPVIDLTTQHVTYKSARIRRIQLEHDTARSLQVDDGDLTGSNSSLPHTNVLLIDLNRAGIGLMEIVTEPDFESAFDAYSFVRELAFILRSLGTCTDSMGDGAFRGLSNTHKHFVKHTEM